MILLWWHFSRQHKKTFLNSADASFFSLVPVDQVLVHRNLCLACVLLHTNHTRIFLFYHQGNHQFMESFQSIRSIVDPTLFSFVFWHSTHSRFFVFFFSCEKFVIQFVIISQLSVGMLVICILVYRIGCNLNATLIFVKWNHRGKQNEKKKQTINTFRYVRMWDTVIGNKDTKTQIVSIFPKWFMWFFLFIFFSLSFSLHKRNADVDVCATMNQVSKEKREKKKLS